MMATMITPDITLYGIANCDVICVDLDGTTGPGALTSKTINYAAGQKLTISFDLSGNQRDLGNDVFNFTSYFGTPTDITGFMCTTGFDPLQCGTGSFFGLSSLGFYAETINGATAFKTYSLMFTPVNAGSMNLYFGTTSADNVGPILDNVLVSQVPEPASWAMLITGFGMIGFASRRRVAVSA